jgi:hypothetical protein
VKVLVVGVARSGTSFLGEIFRQNPDMAYLYEPFWGNTVIKERQCIWLTEGDHEPQSERLLRDVFNGQFDELERQQPRPQNPQFSSRREEATRYLRGGEIERGTDVVMKEIRLNMQMRWVLKVVGPDLRIVHLVRDPRGVAASFLLPMENTIKDEISEAQNGSRAHRFLSRPLAFLNSGQAVEQTMYAGWEWNKAPEMQRFAPEFQSYGRWLDTGAPHQRIAARWALLTGHAIADSEKVPAAQYHRVRYEDLCRDPAGVSSRIYEFLGKPMPQTVTEWLLQNTRNGNREDRYATSRNSREMIDVWKSQLTRRQARAIESLCRPLMEVLGYS